jgi:hypothetical protein
MFAKTSALTILNRLSTVVERRVRSINESFADRETGQSN